MNNVGARAMQKLKTRPCPLFYPHSLSSIQTHLHLQHTQHPFPSHKPLTPNFILSLLHKHPTSHKFVQQVHAYLTTTGLLRQTHNLLLFNNLIRCYSFGPFPNEPFLLLKSLLGLRKVDSFTLNFVLNACVNLGCVAPGVQVHGVTVKMGFCSHVYVQTALVYMYVSCGYLGSAVRVFEEMPERNSVSWNILVTGFAKWQRVDVACGILEEMPERNVVSWTAIIDGFTRVCRYDDAMNMFWRMIVDDGIEPSEITILAIFPAISNLGAIKICRSLHCYCLKRGFTEFDIRVANLFIDSYAKCGCIVSALKFFEEINVGRKNVVSWTSIIAGLAMHGLGRKAVEKFEEMEKAGIKPNRVTLLSILSACSHGGLVEEGLRIFEKMSSDYQISPDIKHYGTVVDMLGRAGRLEEAENIALKVPKDIENVVIWRTILGSCSFHGDVDRAERVTKRILEMERGYGGDYVLASNIYVGIGRFGDAEALRHLMDQRRASKLPGQSSL